MNGIDRITITIQQINQNRDVNENDKSEIKRTI